MIVPPTLPPPTPAVQPAVTPQQAATLAPALVAAQGTASVVRTQTANAPSATGKADQSRNARDGAKSDRAVDQEAHVIRARTEGRQPGRGNRLDVSI